MRIRPYIVNDSDQGVGTTFPLQPRGRLLTGYNGFRLYVEAERVPFMRDPSADPSNPPDALVEDALRISMGLQFDTPHFGMSAGTHLGVGDALAGAVSGGSGRLRFSQERYQHVVELRPRKVMRLDLAEYKGERGTARLVHQIDELTRLGAPALLLDARRGSNSYAQVEELREALLRFRNSGGRVATFLAGGSTRSYFLASVSDRIYAQPGSELNIVGLTLRGLYWGELLRKIGVESDFVRIAEYKGAAETYSRGSASEPVAAQREQLLMDSWNHVVRSIAKERGLQPRELVSWIDQAPLTPERALALGLVDELRYADELDDALEAWLRRRVRIESPSKAPRQAGDWGKRAHVAVLYVDGDLVDGKSAVLPIVGTKLAGAETLTEEIRRLRKDPQVRALVLRVASRGGSVSAARSIAHELDVTRETKPVIVSFGSVAASGGYWIATGGDYIFADALSMTGSIGIFYPKMDLSGLLERIGVGVDLVSFGRHAHMRSWFRAYTEEERQAAQASIQYSYDEFTTRVGKARSMTPEQVDAVARGRIWSGVRAIDKGLVDAYGGLREAIQRARSVADLPSNAPAYTYPAPPSLIDQIKTLFGLRLPRLARSSADPGGDLAGELPGAGWGRVVAGTRQVPPELAATPLMRVLAQIPPSLWLLEAPEAMALAEHELELE
jgi:protease-4